MTIVGCSLCSNGSIEYRRKKRLSGAGYSMARNIEHGRKKRLSGAGFWV